MRGHFTHGMFGTPTHNSWRAMINRVDAKSGPNWTYYGSRGISVCDRWRDFAKFFEDMGPRGDGKTLDRINNDKGYGPGNCRWATRAEQTANQRKPKKLTPRDVAEIRTGIRAGVHQRVLARRFGVSQAAIHDIKIGKLWKNVPQELSAKAA